MISVKASAVLDLDDVCVQALLVQADGDIFSLAILDVTVSALSQPSRSLGPAVILVDPFS